MRLALLVIALALAGCGDDTTGGGESIDMSQPVLDIAQPGHVCGASVCAGSCTGCISFGGGVCVVPCKLAAPSCPSGSCMPRASDDGGVPSSVMLSGDCAGYDGYCG